MEDPTRASTPGPASTGPFDPADLPEVEARLEVLGQSLDTGMPTTTFGLVALGFGHRARSLWRGLLHASSGPSDASVQLILRGLVEMTILLPWLAKNPDVHLALWGAEGERQILKLLRDGPTNAGTQLAAGLAQRATPERLAAIERAVAEARSRGRAANTIGLRPNGSLLPSLPEMVRAVNTPAAREAYTISYNFLSDFTHSGSRSLAEGVMAGGIFNDGPSQDSRGDRALAAVSYAMVLEVASQAASLGIEDDARRLRARILASSPAAS